MAPIELPRALKEHFARAYAEYTVADPLRTRGVIRVSTRLVAGQRSEADLDGHRIVCDEPVERAGTGAGPAPLPYFLAALGF